MGVEKQGDLNRLVQYISTREGLGSVVEVIDYTLQWDVEFNKTVRGKKGSCWEGCSDYIHLKCLLGRSESCLGRCVPDKDKASSKRPGWERTEPSWLMQLDEDTLVKVSDVGWQNHEERILGPRSSAYPRLIVILQSLNHSFI